MTDTKRTEDKASPEWIKTLRGMVFERGLKWIEPRIQTEATHYFGDRENFEWESLECGIGLHMFKGGLGDVFGELRMERSQPIKTKVCSGETLEPLFELYRVWYMRTWHAPSSTSAMALLSGLRNMLYDVSDDTIKEAMAYALRVLRQSNPETFRNCVRELQHEGIKTDMAVLFQVPEAILHGDPGRQHLTSRGSAGVILPGGFGPRWTEHRVEDAEESTTSLNIHPTTLL